LGIELFKSVLMYSNGTICLIKLLFKMGLFTVWQILCVFRTTVQIAGRRREGGVSKFTLRFLTDTVGEKLLRPSSI
jgi:hypothetical protein